MNTLRDFSEQASRFATRPEDHAKTRENVARVIHELRTSAVGLAVECILLGSPEAASDVMADCLTQQMDLAKIRHLEVVPAVTR